MNRKVTQVARTTAEKPAPDDTETAPADEPVEDTGEPAENDEPPENKPDKSDESPEAASEMAKNSPEDAPETADDSPEDAPEAEAETPEDAPEKKPRWRPRDPVLLVAVALTVVAAACAAYFGHSWYAAAHDDSLAYSRDRDAVLRAAEQGVQNMNTLDYRKVDQGLTSWEDSSTGDLRQELVQGRAQFAAQVRQAQTVTTAKILDAAVTELDDRVGKAGVIVAVQITVTPSSGGPTTKQSRMRAQLSRTPSGWKLSALGQAPLGSTANGG